MASQSSKKATQMQADSAAEATQLQREQFNKQVELQEPFRQTGVAANSRLAYLMGLGGTAPAPAVGTTMTMPAATPAASAPVLNRDTLRSQLLSQFTRTQAAEAAPQTTNQPAAPKPYVDPSASGWSPDMAYQAQERTDANAESFIGQPFPGYAASTSYVDEAGLNAEIDRLMAAQGQAQAPQAPAMTQEQAAAAPMATTPGSLLRTFTAADLEADPVYQNGLKFGLDEGRKGIDRQAAARGSALSGATLKALTRFGSDYGSTKANDSYNRFQNNQNSIYNKLAGVSGAGQQATNQVGNASQNFANGASGNIIGAGNSRAAGYIGGGNAITGGISQAVNSWQNNRMMDRIFPNGGAATPVVDSEAWRTTGSGMPSYFN
jgi:hypothetical protein